MSCDRLDGEREVQVHVLELVQDAYHDREAGDALPDMLGYVIVDSYIPVSLFYMIYYVML